jgi:hypothetical protein
MTIMNKPAGRDTSYHDTAPPPTVLRLASDHEERELALSG